MAVHIENRSVALGSLAHADWHNPYFGLFANNVRMAGAIEMGEARIHVFRPRENDDAFGLL